MSYTINEIKEKTVPIAKEFGIKSMSLFGSYARGDANDNSDVDIFIDKGKMRSLIRYYMFVQELEKVLNCYVDVVKTGIEDKKFLLHIMNDWVLI